ncbi:MAG: EamA family transporter RarD [Myxococcales bacterium]|nr:MAG: EamA family transporter RarD [Myxococcales bacterium]
MPLYVKALGRVPPLQIVAHRVVWASAVLAVLVVATRQVGWLTLVRRRPGLLWTLGLSAAALSVNWLVYIWAVGQGRVVDASLGYFINPLLSVVLGVVVLKERLRSVQWIAVGVAALGVLWLSLLAGELPWIGLTVAASFGVYGLLRKTAPIDALGGLTLETLLLLPVALGYVVYSAFGAGGAFAGGGSTRTLLLLAAGPVTALPLLAFGAGARRIPLALVGILQYVAPTLQLLLGIAAFGEVLPKRKLFGFALIWLAVLLYSAEVLVTRARSAVDSDA